MRPTDSPLNALMRAIAAGDSATGSATVARLIAASPGLARMPAREGATREEEKAHWLDDIQHYI